MFCPATNPLLDQLQHSVIFACSILLVGLIALGLDRFATYLGRAGARDETVHLIRLLAVWLLGLDVLAIGVLASCGVCRLIWCAL